MTATPAELESWIRQAAAALQAGRSKDGRVLLDRVVATGRANIQVWMLLALACRQMGDAAAFDHAVDEALRHDESNLFALIWKGDGFVAARDEQAAISFYGRALRLARGLDVPRDLAAELERASTAIQAATTRFRSHLEGFLTSQGFPSGARNTRFQEAIDILTGERRIYYQQPSAFYFPQLPQRQFYEREEFDWIPALEAQTDSIRAELDGLLETRDAFRTHQVNPRGWPGGERDDLDRSACYLWEKGEPVTEHIARCPHSFDAIRHTPLCDIVPRAPTISFSLLRGGGHMSAQGGLTNARLTCHLPLRVPPGCRLRVGNDIREWQVGKLLIFDDTIEHEAWNESDEDHVVLVFDIWRPELGDEDRVAVQAIFAATDAYTANPPAAA